MAHNGAPLIPPGYTRRHSNLATPKVWPWEVHFVNRTGLLGSHSIWLKLYVRFVQRTTQERPDFQLLR